MSTFSETGKGPLCLEDWMGQGTNILATVIKQWLTKFVNDTSVSFSLTWDNPVKLRSYHRLCSSGSQFGDCWLDKALLITDLPLLISLPDFYRCVLPNNLLVINSFSQYLPLGNPNQDNRFVNCINYLSLSFLIWKLGLVILFISPTGSFQI